jgi:hypothetical protein
MAKRPYISLARDKSKRPIRGQPAGDMVTGPCEAVGCGIVLHRGDRFVVYLGDRLMCSACHEADKPLTARTGPSPKRVRPARGGRPRKRVVLAMLRAARTQQLREELAWP